MMPVYVNEGRTAGLERWSQIHQEVGFMKLSGSVLLFYGEHLWEHVKISARAMEKFSERFSKEDFIELLELQLQELYREREEFEHLARLYFFF